MHTLASWEKAIECFIPRTSAGLEVGQWTCTSVGSQNKTLFSQDKHNLYHIYLNTRQVFFPPLGMGGVGGEKPLVLLHIRKPH